MHNDNASIAKMGDGAALVTLRRRYSEDVEIDPKGQFIVDAMTTLVAAKQRLNDGDVPDDDAVAAIFELLRRIADDVDGIERSLLRCLKFDGEECYTWQQIAEKSGGFYDSRQSAQKRWSRLTDHSRRTASRDPRRGAAVKRSRPAANVVDTMTEPSQRLDGQTAGKVE